MTGIQPAVTLTNFEPPTHLSSCCFLGSGEWARLVPFCLGVAVALSASSSSDSSSSSPSSPSSLSARLCSVKFMVAYMIQVTSYDLCKVL